MNLKTAFDTEHNGRLLNKLQSYGIDCNDGNELKWFENYIINRQQYTVIGGVKSQTEHIIYRSQGSLLGHSYFFF